MNTLDRSGRTALQLAVYCGNQRAVQVLEDAAAIDLFVEEE